MRIFAYSVYEGEEKYVRQFMDENPGVCEYVPDYPSMDNLHLAKGFDAVSVITNVLSREMYDAWHAMGVKYIATRSIGYDHLDTAYMKRLGMRGVHATYSPDAVANYTIMLMLMACRKVSLIIDRARLQDFSLPGKLGKELSLCTVGIIGTGSIGETVVRHLSGFGCRILMCSHHPKAELEEYGEYVDFDTVCRECDIISLHVPGSVSNRHLIDADAVSKMKDGVILVNTARGPVVDSEALIAGLESGKIGYAALDTFEEERGMYYRNLEGSVLSNRTMDALRSFPNVILTPHMAFYTEQSTSMKVTTSFNALLALENGGYVPLEVNYGD